MADVGLPTPWRRLPCGDPTGMRRSAFETIPKPKSTEAVGAGVDTQAVESQEVV